MHVYTVVCLAVVTAASHMYVWEKGPQNACILRGTSHGSQGRGRPVIAPWQALQVAGIDRPLVEYGASRFANTFATGLGNAFCARRQRKRRRRGRQAAAGNVGLEFVCIVVLQPPRDPLRARCGGRIVLEPPRDPFRERCGGGRRRLAVARGLPGAWLEQTLWPGVAEVLRQFNGVGLSFS